MDIVKTDVDICLEKVLGCFPALNRPASENQCNDNNSTVVALSALRKQYVAMHLSSRVEQSESSRLIQLWNKVLASHVDNDGLERLLRSPALFQALRLDYSDEVLAVSLAHEINGSNAQANNSTVGGCILEDNLPVVLEVPSSGLIEPRVSNEFELQSSLQIISEAELELAACSNSANTLFKELVSSLVIRYDDARSSEMWGASSGLAVGRVVVVNPTMARSPLCVADILLHETIHTTLSIVELAEPLVEEQGAYSKYQFASPWSGNSLHLYAFLHATAVWASLYSFWGDVLKSPRSSEIKKQAADRREYIHAGFKSPSFNKIINRISSSISQSARHVLTASGEMVLEA